MSWVTRTIAFALFASCRTRALLFSRKTWSPVARTSSRRRMSGSTSVDPDILILVEEEDVGIDRGRDREPEPGAHAGRVRLDRGIDELADVGEVDDRLLAADH